MAASKIASRYEVLYYLHFSRRVTYKVVLVIDDAEARGLLHPHTGSRIFEGTVGSTGISIATIARAKYGLCNNVDVACC